MAIITLKIAKSDLCRTCRLWMDSEEIHIHKYYTCIADPRCLNRNCSYHCPQNCRCFIEPITVKPKNSFTFAKLVSSIVSFFNGDRLNRKPKCSQCDDSGWWIDPWDVMPNIANPPSPCPKCKQR
jgi:hypothetical protein